MHASDFFYVREESNSNLWKTFLEGEPEATQKHVRAHNPVVLCVQNDASAILVLLFSDEFAVEDQE